MKNIKTLDQIKTQYYGKIGTPERDRLENELDALRTSFKINAKDIIPGRSTHPGTVLNNELRERGIKQKDFAKALDMAVPNLSELIKGKRNITEAIAIKLEKALGISFHTWINLQSRYNYMIKR